MSRIRKIRKCFDVSYALSIKCRSYQKYIYSVFNELLAEDIGKNDVTLSPRDVYACSAHAVIVAKSPAVIAGLDETLFFIPNFYLIGETKFKNGGFIAPGEELLHLSGRAGDILRLERTILNILQRLSGIATTTRQYAELISETGCFVVATRKTIWGLLDKRAVQSGGGLSHRLGLYDAAILKENHLAVLRQTGQPDAISNAVQAIISRRPKIRFIEIEVTHKAEFWEMVSVFESIKTDIPKVIMFDHFPPEQIAVIISELKERGIYDRILLEASGNINLENVVQYAQTGVDVISVGALTHSVKSADFSLIFSV